MVQNSYGEILHPMVISFCSAISKNSLPVSTTFVIFCVKSAIFIFFVFICAWPHANAGRSAARIIANVFFIIYFDKLSLYPYSGTKLNKKDVYL